MYVNSARCEVVLRVIMSVWRELVIPMVEFDCRAAILGTPSVPRSSRRYSPGATTMRPTAVSASAVCSASLLLTVDVGAKGGAEGGGSEGAPRAPVARYRSASDLERTAEPQHCLVLARGASIGKRSDGVTLTRALRPQPDY